MSATTRRIECRRGKMVEDVGEKMIRSTARAASLGRAQRWEGRRVVRFGGRSAKKGRSGRPLFLGSATEPTLSRFDPRLKPPLHSALPSLFYPGGQRVQQCRRGE